MDAPWPGPRLALGLNFEASAGAGHKILGWPLAWPWLALGLALAGPWPGPWLALGLAVGWPLAWPWLALGLALGWPLAWPLAGPWAGPWLALGLSFEASAAALGFKERFTIYIISPPHM